MTAAFHRVAIEALISRFHFVIRLRLIVWGILATAPSGVAADGQDFSLQVTPATAEIPQGRETTVMVLLQNVSSNVLENVQITTFSNSLFNVKIEPKLNSSIMPKAALAWMAQISSTNTTVAPGNVYFRVDFDRRLKAEDTNLISMTAAASVAITMQAAQPVSDIAEVKVETTAESLNEKRPGTVHVMIKSKVNAPLKVEPIRIRGPSYLTIAPLETNLWTVIAQNRSQTSNVNVGWFSIAPYESRVISYSVTANSQVTPGKQLLVIEVPLTWEKSGYSQSSTLVTTQQIDVGIFGEAAILEALGVPVFLFLPGFLILTTFGLLYNLDRTSEEKAAYPLKDKQVFYLLAITLSMIAFAAYPFLTKAITNVSRDILKAYGLLDVVCVWFGSIVVGSVAFAVARTVAKIRVRIKENRRSAHDFSSEDDELGFLKKLALRNRGIVFEKFTLAKGDSAYVIEGAESGKSWIAPAIGMNWEQSKAAIADQAIISPAIDNDDPTIITLIEEAIAKKSLQLKWKPAGTVTRLQKIDNSTLGAKVDDLPILENA